MTSYFRVFFFDIYPYICLAVFIVASLIRYDQAQYTWKSDSSQLLRKKGMWIGSNLFHFGILLLFLGHLIGLLTPHGVYTLIISAPHKQLLAVIAGGIFGTSCFIGLSILLYRRLFDARIRKTSHFSDILILCVLYTQVILGLTTIPISLSHHDGSSMIALGDWAQSIVTFQGNPSHFLINESIIFKLHIVLGLTIFLIFPFTRLVHVFSGIIAPFKYLYRSGYQIVRKRG